MQFSGFWIKKKKPTVRINWSNLIEPVTLFENQINSAEVYFWLCLFSYVYIRNLNWLLLYLYLQVNAGFIAPNIRWLEFLHKYHNYANKKHKVYLGEKKKIMTMIYFFFKYENDTFSVTCWLHCLIVSAKKKKTCAHQNQTAKISPLKASLTTIL